MQYHYWKVFLPIHNAIVGYACYWHFMWANISSDNNPIFYVSQRMQRYDITLMDSTPLSWLFLEKLLQRRIETESFLTIDMVVSNIAMYPLRHRKTEKVKLLKKNM